MVYLLRGGMRHDLGKDRDRGCDRERDPPGPWFRRSSVGVLMDTATTIAVFGFLGSTITAMVGGFVAIYTNRTEKKQTAEVSVEKTLRERIVLRDEKIAELQEDLQELRESLEWEKKRKPCQECLLYQNLRPEERQA